MRAVDSWNTRFLENREWRTEVEARREWRSNESRRQVRKHDISKPCFPSECSTRPFSFSICHSRYLENRTFHPSVLLACSVFPYATHNISKTVPSTRLRYSPVQFFHMPLTISQKPCFPLDCGSRTIGFSMRHSRYLKNRAFHPSAVLTRSAFPYATHDISKTVLSTRVCCSPVQFFHMPLTISRKPCLPLDCGTRPFSLSICHPRHLKTRKS